MNINENNLKAALYGTDLSQNVRIFTIDSDGKLILSPELSIDVVSDNLDLRSVNSTRDSITISATDFDIRSLNGTQDSVQIYNKSFVEDSDSGTILALGTRIFLTKNIGNYKNNIYVVRNTGGVAVTLTLQIAPVDIDNYYINSGSQFNLLAGGIQIFTANNLMKYARISVSALLLGSVTVYYFGQA